MFALAEIIDLIIMTLGVGYIFMDLFSTHAEHAAEDPISYWQKKKTSNFKFAIYVTAPAIILHEVMHKLIALSFGLKAVFHAAYTWLGFGMVLKFLNTGLIFFVPGYVSISGDLTPLKHLLVAGAGPFTNLTLYFISSLVLKYKKLSKNLTLIFAVSKKLNLFLFFFNMIPVPPFDGYAFFKSLYSLLAL